MLHRQEVEVAALVAQWSDQLIAAMEGYNKGTARLNARAQHGFKCLNVRSQRRCKT